MSRALVAALSLPEASPDDFTVIFIAYGTIGPLIQSMNALDALKAMPAAKKVGAMLAGVIGPDGEHYRDVTAALIASRTMDARRLAGLKGVA